MGIRRILVLAASCLLCANGHLYADDVDFNQQIRPILSRHCIACHGPDEGHREAGYRIDTSDGAFDAIEPGDVDNSEAFYRITSTDDDRMPPPEHSAALSPEEIELIRLWIEQGAKFEKHWSFVKPTKTEIPILPDSQAKWVRNPIDQFVGAKLAKHGLAPSKDAEPHRLIRRVALDLTGLPPTMEMVERFVADPSDKMYSQIVDELLASPSYGEHWTAMWLDLARYADSTGYTSDTHRAIWPWRDWVIRAHNENMPFDQFTIEQIAGDLLPSPTVDQRLATAFHRNTLNNSEGGTSNEEFRTIAVKDRISTTINVWMGLTMRCAECHTHKYDPISQTEYYQFLDFFNQTVDADENDERPRMDVFPEGRESIFAKMDAEIDRLKKRIESVQSAGDEKKAEREKLEKQLAAKTKQRQSPIKVPVMVERSTDKRRKTHVNVRGSYLQPGEQVSAAVMEAFHALPESAPLNRLSVANWLVSEENPLTGRVTVNRYWARIFGTGIVATEEDFGSQGSPPTNQPLLDWLAVDFVENEWDIKRLLKQIVTSSTYRQTSVATAEGLEHDPRNHLHSRGPRFRLRAEVVRDQTLAVTGLLSHKKYGPPVYPPNPVKSVRNAFSGPTVWVESKGDDRYRRALYTYLKRTAPHPLFETFDMATRAVCNMRRIRTNTPLQSFMTLNGQAFIEAAQALAVTMYGDSEKPEKQLEHGLTLALRRPADSAQVAALNALYLETLAQYRDSPDEALELTKSIESFGIDAKVAESKAAELAALTVVANVILNLDSFLTK